MPGILAIIREVYWNQINCIYLKNQRRSVDFLLHLYNLHRIWNILEKKNQLHSLSIFEIIHFEEPIQIHLSYKPNIFC